MAVPVYWGNIVMDTNCHSDIRTATGRRLMTMLMIWEDTAVRSNVVGNWEDN